MPEPIIDSAPEAERARSRREGRKDVLYWMVAAAIYIGMGVAAPPLFLLGFWESALFVFAAIVLQPRLLRRTR